MIHTHHGYDVPPSPVVIRHPDVATRIVNIGDVLSPVDAEPFLVERYEDGDVLVANSIDLGLTRADLELIDRIGLPATEDNSLKKANARDLLVKIEPTLFSKHVMSHYFPGEPASGVEFQKIVAKVGSRIRTHVKALFPRYKITGEHITWRMTRSEAEAMHYDEYAGRNNNLHYVRLFVNIDSKPRLWGVADRIEDTIRNFAPTFKALMAEIPDAHPNNLNNRVNTDLPWDKVARHFVAFAPGNVWLVNSQVVGHEATFGRKLIACAFEVDGESILDPSKHFVSRMRRALSEL